MAAHRSFGAAGTRSNVTVLVRSDGLRLPIHRGIADLVAILMDLTELSGVDIRPGQTWGYAYRVIAGTSILSNHSWATAVDINAPANPYASAAWHAANGNRVIRGKRLKTEFTDEIVKLWEDHGFRWGGWYRTKPDPMHFEFMGTMDEARRHASNLRAFLGSSTPPPPAPRSSGQPRMLQVGDRGDDVKVWQQLVGATADGVFGQQTLARTKEFQRKVGIAADGIVGPATHAKMRELLAYLQAVSVAEFPTVRRGDAEGEVVKGLQRKLNEYHFGLKIDGIFGPTTENAVKRFQRGKGLRADGIVGPKTWNALYGRR